MKRWEVSNGLLLITLLLLTGCASIQNQDANRGGNLSFLDVSSYPSNVYVGLSGPYSTKKKMVEEAILDCARNILIKESIALDSKLVLQWNSSDGLKSFASDQQVYYDDTKLISTIDALEIIELYFDQDAGAIVIARNTDQVAEERVYSTAVGQDGKPLWLKTLPKVPGYLFGVGSSKPYYYLNKTLEAADFLAAQNILDLYTDYTFSIEKTQTHDDEMERALYQAQRGLLQGFTIIARYYDESTNTYWSLASSKED